MKATLENGKVIEVSPSLQEDRESQLARTLTFEPLHMGQPSRRHDIAYRNVKDAILPLLDNDVSRVESIYRHREFKHIMCVQLKKGDADAIKTLLSSKVEFKPREGVIVQTRARKYGEKVMRVRLNFVPRGTTPQEIFTWFIENELGEPEKIERCKFDGIEGEAVDITLVPYPDVDWLSQQQEFDRHGMFCGVLCAITFNCLDLKPYCKVCKDFGHLPSSCPDRRAQQIIAEEVKRSAKRTSDEISPLKEPSTESKRNRTIKTAVPRQMQASSPIEKMRGVSENDSGGHLSFTEVVDDEEAELTGSEETCLITDGSVKVLTIFNHSHISSSNPLKCAECDKIFATSSLGLFGKRITDLIGHSVCVGEPDVPRLVCENHPDCCTHEFEEIK